MQLTYKDKAKAQTLLTKEIKKYFKILFDYKIEDEYKLSTIDTIKHPDYDRLFYTKEKVKLYKAFCEFIEKATNMTYTEVEKAYGRKRDGNDKAIDTEFDNEEFPIDHYSLANSGIGRKARIHGYLRDGVFVVRRIDWGHRFHEKTIKNKDFNK